MDLHSHVLPGLDDGAENLAASVEMCREAAAAGIVVLAATPHVRRDYPTTAAAMSAALEAVVAATAEVGIRLVPGAELGLEQLDRPLEELRRYGLAGNPDVLLVETPYAGWPLDLRSRLAKLHAAGIVPILAHPERNAEVQADTARVADLVADGALVQVTAASIDGRLGRRARRTALQLVRSGLAHLIASDAHSPSVRAIGMRAAAEEIADRKLAEWLTIEVPSAVVERRPIPPRPSSGRRRPLRFER